MRKNSNSPNKPVQARNRTAKDFSICKQNIFHIIGEVPKQLTYTTTFTTYKDNLSFTEECISFLEQLHPKALKTLRFNPDIDDLFTLQAQVMKAINKLGYIFEIDSDHPQFCVIYDVYWKEHQFFNFEAKIIESLPEEMKIGFAHWLECFRQTCSDDYSIDFLEKGMTSIDDSPFENHEYYLESFYGDEMEMHGQEEHDAAKQKFEQEELPFYREKYLMLKSYAAKDIRIFKRYKPQSQNLIKIKEMLLEGITKLDFNVWNKFANDMDYCETGALNYERSAFLMWDMERGIEEMIFNEIQHSTQEGSCNAMGWIVCKNGVITRTTKKEEKMFERIQKHILSIADLLYDNYTEVFQS